MKRPVIPTVRGRSRTAQSFGGDAADRLPALVPPGWSLADFGINGVHNELLKPLVGAVGFEPTTR